MKQTAARQAKLNKCDSEREKILEALLEDGIGYVLHWVNLDVDHVLSDEEMEMIEWAVQSKDYLAATKIGTNGRNQKG